MADVAEKSEFVDAFFVHQVVERCRPASGEVQRLFLRFKCAYPSDDREMQKSAGKFLKSMEQAEFVYRVHKVDLELVGRVIHRSQQALGRRVSLLRRQRGSSANKNPIS